MSDWSQSRAAGLWRMVENLPKATVYLLSKSSFMTSHITKKAMTAILADPSAPEILLDLQQQLVEEQKRRNQFYNDIDDDMKVEFINGEIIVHSPVKKEHTDVVGMLYHLLDFYVKMSKSGYVGYEKVMTALTRNDYEPDVVYFGPEKAKAFKKGHWKYPAPDFVVEVLSKSTESRDRGVKFNDYEAHHVKEYWIIDPKTETIEQYFNTDGLFQLHLKASSGQIESQAVKGFVIDIRAVFDAQMNMEATRKILGK
jgi:Uma2 family endonuclease